ncbi:unnamed protein product (macronuclear) [Paramecium tetraurelia]|uniref:Ubiquitin-like domain-containing protein n=1 Tax=Paramecium tetraurelia TaxID=5888 RepID=A0CD14_PARTE|nr:uncharacterized protein GSPATT00037466001 [Paramecium tetraurelia]CAK68681.1 unnamed protein product [Paramecium tetraurelia]|eukprot:XP_001436078.1 hypothetical protein (macronuclear) [Paramecium tetraurelia strain d4-2]
MNVRQIDIKLRNTKLKFQVEYKPEQTAIELMNKLIADLKFPTNAPNPIFFFKGERMDNTKTLDQQRITLPCSEIEAEFIEKIVVTVHNEKLDSQNLKCDIINTMDELGAILLKKLNFRQDYEVRFSMNDQILNQGRNLIEVSPWENITYQIFSKHQFIYDSKQYELEIDVTNSVSTLCTMISQMINVDSEQIQIDQMNKDDAFYFYQVSPNTELKLRIVEIQNNKQVTITIVYGQVTRQMTILKDEKIETLMNKTKTSFFPHNYSQVNVKLIFEDIELSNNNTINQCQIANNDVIQLIVTNKLEKIQICLQHKENPGLRKKSNISLDEQLSVLDKQVFCNKQMEYFYQGKQLDKKETFRQLQITQNDTVIEYKPIEGVQLLLKFQHLEQQNPVEIQALSNELLSKYIYDLIGRETNDVWVSCKNQTIDDIEQTFAALQIQNDLIFYQPTQILLQVQYKDDLYDIYQKRDKCVIDLFDKLREYFEIDESQDFELYYGNETVQGQLLCKKLWAACQKCYKIVPSQNGENDTQTKTYKIYIINQDRLVEFKMNHTKKISDLKQIFLSHYSYPENQPNEFQIRNQPNASFNEEDQLNTLNFCEFQILLKDYINVRTYDRITKDESYFEINFKSKISILIQNLKLENCNCNFYFQNKQINQEKTFQEIEFYDLNTIEYEVQKKQVQWIQVIVIEKNQQQEVQLLEEQTIKDVRQALNLRSADEIELLLSNQSAAKDEQKLKEIAQNGKLTLNQKTKINNPEQPNNQENKCLLNISIKDKRHEIEFEKNKTVEDLRQYIIQQFQQQSDIVIRQGNTILKPSDPIPVSFEFLIVSPLTIKVIIKINKINNQIHQRQLKPNQKVGDIIWDFVRQHSIKGNTINLAWNGKVLDVNKTLKELGVKDGTELNLLI